MLIISYMPKLITNEQERKIMLGVCLKRRILEKLDKKRGLIPRSTLIEKLIIDYLAKK